MGAFGAHCYSVCMSVTVDISPYLTSAIDSFSTVDAQGDLALLQRRRVSIVGARKATLYAKEATRALSLALAKRGVVVVSGGAMGIDRAAHEGAGASNTIAVLGSGINYYYPRINKRLLEEIAQKGLLLSPFEKGMLPTKWSFVVRNELVVALGEVLIIAEADLGSGSMRSAEIAKKFDKEIYVLPHRLDESLGTQKLLQENKAKLITDIESFASRFGIVPKKEESIEDDFFLFCQTMPTLDEAIKRFGQRVYEAELEGDVIIKEGRLFWVA